MAGWAANYCLFGGDCYPGQASRYYKLFKEADMAENGEYDQATIRAILRYLAESALFVNNDRLGIKDSDIIKLNSEDGISQRRIKRSLAYLEEIGAISLVSGRPKLHKLVR